MNISDLWVSRLAVKIVRSKKEKEKIKGNKFLNGPLFA